MNRQGLLSAGSGWAVPYVCGDEPSLIPLYLLPWAGEGKAGTDQVSEAFYYSLWRINPLKIKLSPPTPLPQGEGGL